MSCFCLFMQVYSAISLFTQLEHLTLSRVNMQQKGICENQNLSLKLRPIKFSCIQTDHPILTRRLDFVLTRKKNLSTREFCHSRGPQRENKRKQNDKQILRSCRKAKKAVEHEGDSDTYCCWCTWNSPQWLEKETQGIGDQRKNQNSSDHNIVKIN